MELCLIIGSLSGTLLALLDVAAWAAIATSIAATITAWLEFQGTSKKLSRYSNAVTNLNQTLLWWDSLTAVDRASPMHVKDLVQSCEDILQGETQGWLSTSMSQKVKLFNKAAGQHNSSSTNDDIYGNINAEKV